MMEGEKTEKHCAAVLCGVVSYVGDTFILFQKDEGFIQYVLSEEETQSTSQNMHATQSLPHMLHPRAIPLRSASRINTQSVHSNNLLLFSKELRCFWTGRDEPKGQSGDDDGNQALEEENIAPCVYLTPRRNLA